MLHIVTLKHGIWKGGYLHSGSSQKNNCFMFIDYLYLILGLTVPILQTMLLKMVLKSKPGSEIWLLLALQFKFQYKGNIWEVIYAVIGQMSVTEKACNSPVVHFLHRKRSQSGLLMVRSLFCDCDWNTTSIPFVLSMDLN